MSNRWDFALISTWITTAIMASPEGRSANAAAATTTTAAAAAATAATTAAAARKQLSAEQLLGLSWYVCHALGTSKEMSEE
jgi:hypothetical protein